MSKKPAKIEYSGENPAADGMSMDEFLSQHGFTDSEELTFNIRPLKINDIWLCEYLGIVDVGSKEISGRISEFNIHGGKGLSGDEYEGVKFSFIPGGLFDYILKKKEIKTGTKLALQFLGTEMLENGNRANQWRIVKI